MATSPNWMGVCAEFVVLHIAVLVTLPTIIARASYNAGDLFTGSSAIGACMMHLSSAALCAARLVLALQVLLHVARSHGW
jgi:hypothetical protein